MMTVGVPLTPYARATLASGSRATGYLMPNSLTPASAPAGLSLTLIPSTRTPLPAYSAARALMRGASSLQEEHHDAQKTITAGLPRRSARETVAPSIFGN